MRVLLVEDDKLSVEMLERLLEPYASAIIATDRLAEAMVLAKEAQFDVVLLDLNLLDSRGTQTIERIRDLRATANSPVVVVSGVTPSESTEMAAKQFGADAFVRKTRGLEKALLLAINAVVFSEPPEGREPTFYEHAAALRRMLSIA